MTRSIQSAVALAAILLLLSPAAAAAEPEAKNLTAAFLAAGATVDRLQVYEIAGVVLIRGRAATKAQAEELSRVAQSFGYTRVANLVQIIEHRDEEIARRAEIELAVNRSLDGCKFRVTSEQGIVRVAGQVRHELQKDVAAQVLRNVDGIRSVQLDLSRF